MPQNGEPGQNKAKIMQWLTEDGFKIQEMPDANAQFHIIAEHQGGMKADIIHPANMKDKLIMHGGVLLTDDRKQKLAAMDLGKKVNLFWDLRLILIMSGVGFETLDYSSDRYGLSTIAYYDGLNKNIFMDKFHLLLNSMVYLFMTFDKLFGQPEPSPDLRYIG